MVSSYLSISYNEHILHIFKIYILVIIITSSLEIRDGTCCDVCIPMPGCVNGMCRKEFVNGIEVEIAQTCECERFPATHVLTDSTYKYTGPRCDQRKFDVLNEIFLE